MYYLKYIIIITTICIANYELYSGHFNLLSRSVDFRHINDLLTFFSVCFINGVYIYIVFHMSCLEFLGTSQN